jgi:purine nucleosidase
VSVNEAVPVIIDTDPGIDDALAILLALASPEFDVRGLVTVAGNVGIATTTRNALRVLALAGRADIPVVPGATAPLVRDPIHAAGIHGDDGIGGIGLPEPAGPPHAVDATAWLAETIAAHPGLRLLALGPLTNVARLITERQAAARRIAGIVAMGGAVRERGNVTPFAEFNIAADPEAADIVVRSGIPLVLVPLDVTRKVAATPAWTAQLAATGSRCGALVAEWIDAYMRNITTQRARRAAAAGTVPVPVEACPLHDPCVMLWAAAPLLFTAERLQIRVMTDRSERDGATVIDGSGQPVDVLTGANVEAALAFAAQRLAAA